MDNFDGTEREPCLLYTSDAADELDGVDLGGRRIIKKKFFQAEDGIRDQPRSRGLGDVYKRQAPIRNILPMQYQQRCLRKFATGQMYRIRST